jgi:hypothetical protein
MKRLIRILAIFFGLIILPSASAFPAQIEYTQTRYVAVDQKTCDNFVIFSEREKIFYGSDAKLFPGARFVEVTTGNVRFRNSGMLLKSSNFPPGSGMTS